MRKVLHICTNRANYKILEEKLSLLSKESGYEVYLLSSIEGKDSGYMESLDIKINNIKYQRSISLVNDFLAILKTMIFLRKEKFDIVHTHTAKAGVIGRVAAKMARVPLIIHTCHGLPFYKGQKKLNYVIYKLLEIAAGKFCDYILFQNKEDMYELSNYFSKDKLIYEGNGVNIEKVDNYLLTADYLSLKEKYNIPFEKKVILVGARFEPVKDHLLLFEALALLQEEGINDFVCLLAGNGDLEADLINQVNQLKLNNIVKFIGYQRNMSQFIKIADIVALTSEKEGIPRILMESMVLKKPIIATNVKGTKELVVNNETGLLSEYRNPYELADNIKKLLYDESLRYSLGVNGRKRVVENFTEQLVLKRIIDVYSS